MLDWLLRLFDPAGFPARWHCGEWSAFLGWLHIASDVAIWLAYMGIPAVIVYFVRRRRDVPLRPVFVLFTLFIASCGIGHLIEAGMFWWPAYRFSGAWKLVTAVVSLATLVALVPFTARALALPGTTDLLARLHVESAEHTRSREKLHLTQEQLRVATEASGVGLWDWMIDRNVATWDGQARRLFGIPADATAGGAEYLLGFVDPADRAAVGTALDASLARGTPFDMRFGVVRPDGSRARVAARSSVTCDAHGTPIRLSGAFVDVTAEERSRELFRIAVEASPNAMLLVDARGSIVMANSNAERVFGRAQAALLGTSVDELVPEGVRPRHGALRADYLAAPTARPMGAGRDLFGVRADGTQVPIEIGLNPVATPDGTFVLASIIDITQRKRTEDMLRASLEEKEILLREVHHRVKNNLQVVSSMLSLQTTQVGDAAARTMFEECQTRVRTMAMIHESLYATGNLSSLEFGTLTKSLVEMLARTWLQDRSRLAIDVSAAPLRLGVDLAIPASLVLHELVTNALKHAFRDGAGGRLRVRLDVPQPGCCRLVVEDDGVGLPPDFRLDHDRGLGLRLLRGLVRQLDGRIEAKTGHGATFVVEFATEPKVAATAAG